MRRDDEFDVGIVVYQPDQQLFVGAPGRSGHEEAVFALEAFDDVDMLGGPGDLGHTVETRVAGHEDVVEPERCEEFLRLFVLDEHHVERLQGLAPQTAVGAEEDRIAAEDGRDDIGADLPAAEFAQQVQPVFVFDEDGHVGMCGIEETACVSRGVERQVEDVVGALVVLSDFVTRGGEEGQQDLVFGM